VSTQTREHKLETALKEIIRLQPKPSFAYEYDDDGCPIAEPNSYGNFDDCVSDGIDEGHWHAAEIAIAALKETE
jgi:hypothetical protein